MLNVSVMPNRSGQMMYNDERLRELYREDTTPEEDVMRFC